MHVTELVYYGMFMNLDGLTYTVVLSKVAYLVRFYSAYILMGCWRPYTELGLVVILVTFVDALAYADHLVLQAPAPHAMRSMLQICLEHAKRVWYFIQCWQVEVYEQSSLWSCLQS